MYNEINGGDPGLDPDRGRPHDAGDLLAAVRLQRHDRPPRRRVPERARLVQRHRDPPRRRPPTQIYPIVPANLTAAAAQRHRLRGRRLLPTGDAATRPWQSRQHSWATATGFAARHPQRSELGGRPGGLRPDRQHSAGSVRRRSTRRRTSTSLSPPVQGRPGSRRSSTSRRPIQTATTSPSRTSRPARPAGRVQPGERQSGIGATATTATSTTSSSM